MNRANVTYVHCAAVCETVMCYSADSRGLAQRSQTIRAMLTIMLWPKYFRRTKRHESRVKCESALKVLLVIRMTLNDLEWMLSVTKP